MKRRIIWWFNDFRLKVQQEGKSCRIQTSATRGFNTGLWVLHLKPDFVDLFESLHPNEFQTFQRRWTMTFVFHCQWVAFPFYAYSTLKHTPVWETTQFFHGLRRLLAPPAFYEFAKPQTKLPLCTFMFFIAVFSLTSYFLSRLWTWNSLQNSLQSF